MVSRWGKDPHMRPYLRPATIFHNGEGKRQFEGYLNGGPGNGQQPRAEKTSVDMELEGALFG
jgi:hypothetical protein